MSAFPHILSEGAETVALIIQKVAEVPDLLWDAKVIKRTIIPSNSFVKVKCKANIEFKIKENSVIFQPLIEPQVNKTPEFSRFCETVRKRENLSYIRFHYKPIQSRNSSKKEGYFRNSPQ